MRRSNKSDEAGQHPFTNALAYRDPAPPRSLLPAREKLEDAASTFHLKHDEASFTVLYLAAQKPMTRAVRRRGVRKADVEDVVSIAGATVWFSRRHIEGDTYADFVSYAVGVTRHKALDWCRQEERDARIPIVPMDAGKRMDNVAGERAPSPEDMAALREAFGRLAPREQTALRMYYEGWSFREIGEILGCEKHAARAIYLDAIEQMRRMLA